MTSFTISEATAFCPALLADTGGASSDLAMSGALVSSPCL